jgi:pimeloyl-ACP methyl ester carboxylesterase
MGLGYCELDRMTGMEQQFLTLKPASGQTGSRRIAYRLSQGSSPSAPRLFWLSGYLSDMGSTKATAAAAWAEARGLSMLRFDYSGHGASSGDAANAVISDWLEECFAALELLGEGRVILVGSSMGGWLALLLARQLAAQAEAHRLAGLVLIAPAWDMTEALIWRRLPDEAKRAVETKGIYLQPSNYDDPYPITKRLIEDGRKHLLTGARFDPGCPVRILQGMQDPDVPWRHSLALVELLEASDIVLELIKDGDHRLSRPRDLRRLQSALASLLEP